MKALPRWARVLVALAVVVLVVPLTFGAFFIWSFAGGWDGIRPTARADDRQVARARDGSGVRLDDLTARVLALTGGTTAARVRTDECREGMNDWKNHTGYTLRCERSDLLPVTGTGLTASDMAALDGRLRAAGLTPAYDGGGLRVGDRTASYRLGGDERATVELRLLTPLIHAYDDPLQNLGARSVEGDAVAFHDALVGSREPVLLVRPTWRYFED